MNNDMIDVSFLSEFHYLNLKNIQTFFAVLMTRQAISPRFAISILSKV